jgi:hypothetical protein
MLGGAFFGRVLLGPSGALDGWGRSWVERYWLTAMAFLVHFQASSSKGKQGATAGAGTVAIFSGSLLLSSFPGIVNLSNCWWIRNPALGW